mgnify:CR=1 FL=1
MAHFAQIENNLVTQVIVIDNNDILDDQGNEQESLGTQLCIDLLGGSWKQTSYNSTFRKKYASIDDTYDATLDAFIEPQPFLSWSLNEDTCEWEAPVLRPVDGDTLYGWNEETLSWDEIDEIGV